MAVMKLTDGINTVEFSPRKGYEIPEERRRSIHRTLDGTLYIYEWGQKGKYEIPLVGISKTDKEQIETWWQNITKLTFYPDLVDSPGTSLSVRIINEERPLQMMAPLWNEKFEGTLILREVS